MLDVVGELARELRRAVGEPVGAGIDLEQDGRGVVAQHLGHGRVQVGPVERGHGDAEVLVAAPARQHVGIDRGQQGRQRQAARLGLATQRLRAVGRHDRAAAAEALAGALGRIGRQRQVGPRRQRQRAALPVALAALPGLALAMGDLLHHHVAEAERRPAAARSPDGRTSGPIRGAAHGCWRHRGRSGRSPCAAAPCRRTA